jgi:hypothetical protein
MRRAKGAKLMIVGIDDPSHVIDSEDSQSNTPVISGPLKVEVSPNIDNRAEWSFNILLIAPDAGSTWTSKASCGNSSNQSAPLRRRL